MRKRLMETVPIVRSLRFWYLPDLEIHAPESCSTRIRREDSDFEKHILNLVYSWDIPWAGQCVGYRINGWGVSSLFDGSTFFLFSSSPNKFWGPNRILFNTYRRRMGYNEVAGHKAKPSPQSSAELTNEWRYTSTPQHASIMCIETALLLQWRKMRCQQFIAGHNNSFG